MLYITVLETRDYFLRQTLRDIGAGPIIRRLYEDYMYTPDGPLDHLLPSSRQALVAFDDAQVLSIRKELNPLVAQYRIQEGNTTAIRALEQHTAELWTCARSNIARLGPLTD